MKKSIEIKVGDKLQTRDGKHKFVIESITEAGVQPVLARCIWTEVPHTYFNVRDLATFHFTGQYSQIWEDGPLDLVDPA